MDSFDSVITDPVSSAMYGLLAVDGHLRLEKETHLLLILSIYVNSLITTFYFLEAGMFCVLKLSLVSGVCLVKVAYCQRTA